MRIHVFRYLFVSLLIALAICLAAFYLSAYSWRSKAPATVEIQGGASLRSISHSLATNGVIGAPRIFELYVRLADKERDLKAGTYDFPQGTTMMMAIDRLVSGDVRQYDLTIIEGWTIDEIANALRDKPYLADKSIPNEFVKLARDKAFIESLGFSNMPSLEGYLFPDTYKVAYPLKADELIRRMVARFAEVWKEVAAAGGAASGVDVADTVTLASIVEKETGVASERPLIAGVFKNRLERKVPLQSDPTIIYGLKGFDGNIRKADIMNPHPYNTYVHPGLPPGPICNPGRASLMAALYPEKTDYLYFVSKNDGSHFFSSDLSGHLRAVRRYQVLNAESNKTQ